MWSAKDPMRSAKDPMWSAKDPMRSAKDPMWSVKDPMRSVKDPMWSVKDSMLSAKDSMRRAKSSTPNHEKPQYFCQKRANPPRKGADFAAAASKSAGVGGEGRPSPGLGSGQAAEKLRTIHEITRSSTKKTPSSSYFVCFRGSSCCFLGMGTPFLQSARARLGATVRDTC